MKGCIVFLLILFSIAEGIAQEQVTPPDANYKKRVLESTELDFLTSYYSQDGDNAAVTGGNGSEKLTDLTGAIVVAIPLNDDDVLTIDASISAYTSASSSNIDPFDGQTADAFIASTGASKSDTWKNLTGAWSHNSDDRNTIVSGKVSFSTEYDYTSFGVGGSLTRLFNEKNTEISLNANVYLDSWRIVYPYELRPFAQDGRKLNDPLFTFFTVTGNAQYDPAFTDVTSSGRTSLSSGLVLSQILSKKLQGALAFDVILQTGLLSTPFQRVYFSDVADSYIQNFHLADEIERLPDSRLKIAVGGRLNYYINEMFVVRTSYRYYSDDWGVKSHTASIEVPIKIGGKFTFYPSYRYYDQTAAKYFAPYEQHLSNEIYYTSDYDLSAFSANQYGFGVTYTDIFTKLHVGNFGLKSVDLKFNQYDRNSSFSASIFSAGFKFIMD